MLFDHHIHSRYSYLDSDSDVGDIVSYSEKIGLGGIAISDHNEIQGSVELMGMDTKLIRVPSLEISSADGHIVALGISEIIERDLSAEETIGRIHDKGGLAIAAHPYDTFRHGLKDLCWRLDIDAVEINGHCLYGNSKAKKAAQRHGKPLVGGSDAHSLRDIGAIATEVGGKDAKGILENIKKGECKVVYRRNLASMKASIMADKIVRRL
jgi:predicted metal-dependent phosphoesterase TrpH